MTTTLTYGQLFDKLHQLKFSERVIEMHGKRRHIFEHKTLENALIVLPERQRDDPVEPFYMASVLATLRSHGLIAENHFLPV